MIRKLVVILSLFFLSVGVVRAQTPGLSLVVSPLPINLVAEPGSTVSAQLKIKNGGTITETLTMGLMKFQAFGEEGKPRLFDRAPGDDYFDWVKFSPQTFDLAPNEWKTVTMDITIPKTAAFGYYYAVTFSRKNEDTTTGPRSTKVIGATATMVLLEVRVPNAIRDIQVLEFSTPHKFYEFLPTVFNIKLRNKGNVHVTPRGDIFIDSMTEKNVAALPINDEKGNVLPGTNRIFGSQWLDGFPFYEQVIDGQKIVMDKNGKPVTKLKWDFSQIQRLRIGKYTAHMLLVYDDGKRDIPVESEISFWVMPWRILGITGVVLILTLNGLFSVIINLVKRIRIIRKNVRHNG